MTPTCGLATLSRMQTLNEWLFAQWSAGAFPNPWWLELALASSQAASWTILAVLVLSIVAAPKTAPDVLVAVACACATSLLAHALASWIDSPRPFMMGLSENHAAHGVRGGMPSTHASVMFALAACLAWRPALSVAAVIVASLGVATGLARIYLGVHFPFDVIAGALLGAICGTSAAVLWARVRARIQAAHAARRRAVTVRRRGARFRTQFPAGR